MKLTLYVSSFIFVLLLMLSGPVRAQTELDRGVEFYKKGDYKSAIRVLKIVSKDNSADARAWYFLGAAYLKEKKTKEAINAFKKSVEIDPKDARPFSGLAYAYLLKNNLADAQAAATKALDLNKQDAETNYISGLIYFRNGLYNLAYERAKKTIQISPLLASAHLLKAEALITSFAQLSGTVSKVASTRGELLREAVADLDKYLALSPKGEETKYYQEYLESIKFFADYYSDPVHKLPAVFDPNATGDGSSSAGDNSTPIKILSKPRPEYTDEARKQLVSGVIRLLVGFSEDGRVKYVSVLRPLGYGLDQQAVRAARAIKFQPATRDGKPVPVVKMIEYTFSVR